MKIAMISGASRGIGKATAIRFAKEGYGLALTALQNAEKLHECQREIEALGTPCFADLCDMSDFKACEDFFLRLHRQYGRLDVLVNNAALSYIGLLQDMSPEDWDRILKTNLYSAFYTSRLAIPLFLRQGGGHIINISSVWGSAGAACEVAYSSSKGALHAFTKALAKELAPSRIAVNAVAAGLIDTDMNAFLGEEEKSALLQGIAAGRMGSPEEVAELIFMLSCQSPYLSGQIIGIDGAWI